MNATLYYIHDPMCSWCWAFKPVWQEVQARIPAGIKVRYLLGGLAPDTDQPMPEAMRERITATWRRIQQSVPGTRFNFDFWIRCRPRRATFAACRAVIAAGQQDPAAELSMNEAIQRAYYTDARNPSDEPVLIELAGETGLDTDRFSADLNSAVTHALFEQQRSLAHSMAVDSYPALMLDLADSYRPIPYDYNDATPTLKLLQRALVT